MSIHLEKKVWFFPHFFQKTFNKTGKFNKKREQMLSFFFAIFGFLWLLRSYITVVTTFACPLDKCFMRNLQLLRRFPCRNFSPFPQLCQLTKRIGSLFCRSSKLDPPLLCRGNSFCLPLFNIIPLNMCDVT